MPNYIYGNPVPGYPNNAYGMPSQQQYGYAMPQSTAAPPPEYMINVDGDVGARAWQMPQGLPPNTVIPLFDFDGVHVYFRSVDMYGRPNPIRKGRMLCAGSGGQRFRERDSWRRGSDRYGSEPERESETDGIRRE